MIIMKHSIFLLKGISIPLLCLMLVLEVGAQAVVSLDNLSAFKNPGKSWQIVGGVKADLDKVNKLNTSKGKGILINLSDKKNHGTDLFTNAEYGDIDLELDYLVASGSNSGIYLQGRYELQLEDSWGVKVPTSAHNGGVYERWDDNRPSGQKGFQGYAPRHNTSRAPGLWQNLKISFQAPRFDADGHKIENAMLLRVELNGVVIHKDLELLGPTRGAISNKEAATGPLRIQGDHGSIAFRNIKIQPYDEPRPESKRISKRRVYPILIDAHVNKVFRSFMDLPGDIRLPHAVSVGSEDNVHYTYDVTKGMIVQVWRGGFLDATPMWHNRGDGSSRPVGTVQYLGNPALTLAKLSSQKAAWAKDTTGTGFRPKGYKLDDEGRPIFRYISYGVLVTDASTVLENGRGIAREIKVQNPVPDLYVRLAEGADIEEHANGLYLIDNSSYYLRLDDNGGAKPILRTSTNGGKELIIPMRDKLNYTILF